MSPRGRPLRLVPSRDCRFPDHDFTSVYAEKNSSLPMRSIRTACSLFALTIQEGNRIVFVEHLHFASGSFRDIVQRSRFNSASATDKPYELLLQPRPR